MNVFNSATAQGSNVRLWAGQAVPGKTGGKEKQQQKNPRIRVFKCFCHRARGIVVLVQFGAGSSEDSQVRGP